MEVACGMPLILLDDVGAGDADGDFAARGFGIGIEAIAPPILDLGLFFALTLPDFSRVSNLLAKKLAVFAKVLMSSTACSTLPVPEDFSITSMRRRNSSRSLTMPSCPGSSTWLWLGAQPLAHTGIDACA